MKRKQLLSYLLVFSMTMSNFAPLTAYASEVPDTAVETEAEIVPEYTYMVEEENTEHTDEDLVLETAQEEEVSGDEDVILAADEEASDLPEEIILDTAEETEVDEADLLEELEKDAALAEQLDEPEDENWRDYASEIVPGSDVTVSLEKGEQLYLKFTVAEAGRYIIYSTGDTDTYGYLFDAEEELDRNDDGGESSNFQIVADLEEGTYYVIAEGYGMRAVEAMTVWINQMEAEGFHETEEGTYYIDNGKRYRDCIKVIDGVVYAFDADGFVTESAYPEGDGLVHICGAPFFFEEGEMVRDALRTVDGETYYFDWDGKALQNEDCRWIYDSELDEGYAYSFDEYGHMRKGLYQNKEGRWYYADEEGHVVQQDKVLIDGQYYFFYPYMYQDGWGGVWSGEDDEYCRFYCYPDGHMAEPGWLSINDYEYYVGENRYLCTGRTEIDGVYYYFDDYKAVNRMIKIGNTMYYYGEDGVEEGQLELSKDGLVEFCGNIYYVKDGALVKNQTVRDGGYIYYFGYSGEAIKNCQYSFWTYDEDGNGMEQTIYADPDGHLFTGMFEQYGDWYYADENGIMQNGLITIDGKQYYFNDYMYMNTAVLFDGKFYILGEDGAVTDVIDLTEDGIVNIDGEEYFVKDGDILRDSLVTYQGHTYGTDYYGMINKMAFCYYYNEAEDDYSEYFFDENGWMQTGWFEQDGAVYYADETGAVQNGLITIDGKQYYFNVHMYMNTAVLLDDKFYVLGKDGAVTEVIDLTEDGIVNIAGTEYFVKDGDILRDSLVTYQGHTYGTDYSGRILKDRFSYYYDEEEYEEYEYYFDENGWMQNGWITRSNSVYYADEKGHLVYGLAEIAGDFYYFDDNMQKNVSYCINQTLYYFGKDGKATQIVPLSQTEGLVEFMEDLYYVKDGSLVKREFVEEGGYRYFFDYSGKAYRDRFFYRWEGEEEEIELKYYADAYGHIQTGFFYAKDEGDWYYADEAGVIQSGFITIDGKQYYFNDNLYRNTTAVIDGKIYVFANLGEIEETVAMDQDGFITVKDETFIVKDGEVVKHSLIEVEGFIYGTDWSGHVVKDGRCNFYDEETDEYYYYSFDRYGHLLTGWFEQDRNTYYADADGRMAEGLTVIDGDTYYFNLAMLKNRTALDHNVIYYFGNDGKLVEKLNLLEEEGLVSFHGDDYYVENHRIKEEAWGTVGTDRYYFGEGGAAYRDTWEWIDGYEYIFDADGHVMRGGIFEWDNSTYYADESGRLQKGLVVVGEDTYYFNYWMYTNRSIIQDGIYYYFGNNGKMSLQINLKEKEGLLDVNGETFCIVNGEVVSDQIYKIGDYYYGFDYDGHMIKNNWEWLYDENRIGDDRYYFDDEGHMCIGWIHTQWGSDYYANPNGTLAYGMTKIGTDTYYFSPSMKRSYAYIDNKGMLYFFGSDGKLAHEESVKDRAEGFIELGGNTYYLKNGSFYDEGIYEIDHKLYFISYDGCLGKNEIIGWNGDQYGVNENGEIYRETWFTMYGNKYLADQYGRLAEGIVTLDGNTYCFYPAMVKDTTIVRENIIYHFDKNGVCDSKIVARDQETGFIVQENGIYYVKDEEIVIDDAVKQGDFEYAFGYNGNICKNGTLYLEGSDSFVKTNQYGQVMTGWYEDRYGNLFYLEEDGRCKDVSGERKIDGKEYYQFYSEGLARNQTVVIQKEKIAFYGNDGVKTEEVEIAALKDGVFTFHGEKFLISNGMLASGIQYVELNGKKYVYSNGQQYIYGLLEKDGKYYFVDEAGILIEGAGWHTLGNGSQIYLNADGTIPRNIYMVEGKSYLPFDTFRYLEEDIYPVNDDDEILLIKGKNGEIVKRWNRMELTPGIHTESGKTFYISDDHWVMNGLTNVDGDLCFFNPYMMKNRMYVGGYEGNRILYYFGEDGKAINNGWAEVNGSKVYAYSSGKLAAGICTIDGKKYCFNESGYLQKSTKVRDWDYVLGSEVEYTVNANGVISKSVVVHTHKAGLVKEENRVEATCTKEGSYEKVTFCQICEEEMSRVSVVLEKAPHTEIPVAAVAPTCTKEGKTEGSKCSVCNAVVKAQTSVPKIAHTEKAVEEVAATFTKAGATAGVICGVCGTAISGADPVYIDLSSAVIKVSDVMYTTKPVTPAVSVTLDGTTVPAEAYAVTYKNNVNVGTASVVVTGKGGCNGSATATFEIKNSIPKKVTGVAVENAANGVKVTWKAADLASSYEVYRGTKKVATVKAGTTSYLDKGAKQNGTKYVYKIKALSDTGAAPLSAGVTTYFMTRPAAPAAANTAAGKMTVTWKQNTAANGYEVQYATNAKCTANVKTVVIKSGKTLKTVIAKLTKKKTYYVRVRAYKTVSKKQYYSAWSTAKKIVIKK